MADLNVNSIGPASGATVSITGLSFSGTPWYDVRISGAKVDGTTDDLAALNGALATIAAAGGGILYIPVGTLAVSAAPTIPTGVPIRIVGAGMIRTIIKHLTGGQVINWTMTHVVGEFGSGIEDLTIDGNNTSSTVARFVNGTFFSRRRVTIRNGTGALGAGSGAGTGLEWVSMWDSSSYTTYVTDCGGGASPCALFDALGVGSNTLNNNQEYDLHIEPTDRDCDYLSLLGNATNEVGDNAFFGLKIHGNPTTGNPGAGHYLLKLSQYAKFNSFHHAILGFGKGTAQCFIDGQRNSMYHPTCGVGGAGNPTYAFQFGGNSADNALWSPNVKTPSLYGAGNVCFRFDALSVHNKVMWPVGNYGSVAPYSDAARNMVWWDDLGSNVGLQIYNADGVGTVQPGFVQTESYIQPITFNAALAVNAQAANEQSVTLTGNTVVGIPTNPSKGQRLTLTFVQGGAGGFTVGWNASFKIVWSDAGNTVGKQSSVTVRYDNTNWQQVTPQSPYV